MRAYPPGRLSRTRQNLLQMPVPLIGAVLASTKLERRSFGYSGLDAAMAFTDEAIGNSRRRLAALPQGGRAGGVAGGREGALPEVAGEDFVEAALRLQSTDG
jgi:hypothetical protein